VKKLSIVTPCYNERDNVEELHRRIKDIVSKLAGYDYEHIYIDNASTDGTQELLRKIAKGDPKVRVIINARNFGHIRSPFHGLMQATGDAAIILASDFQDPPDLIPDFVKKWEEGYSAVVGVKNKSEESPLFFFVRRCYYRLVHRLADTEIIQNYTGFGLYDRAVLDFCRRLNDPYPYFRGLISEIGLPTAIITYVQPVRKRGITKNNFYTLYDMAMLGITNHSKVPLRIATMLGFAMSFLSLLAAIGYLIYKLLFWDRFSVGIAPVVIGLFAFSSVQLFFIGILGEYIGAIHTQVLNRPHVVEKERINFPMENKR
jgi:glycosyltransferase involved in cell wall biosynthesis